MIRSLQVALIIAGLIPLVLGTMNFIGGAYVARLPEGSATANVDNQLRFYAIWFTVPFFFAVWMARNLERALPIAQILFGVMFLAGMARLFSVSQVGWPDPPMIGAMVIEIVFVLFIPWIAHVSRHLQQSASQLPRTGVEGMS